MEELKKQIESLLEENRKLQHENLDLKSELSDKESEIALLKDENERLKGQASYITELKQRTTHFKKCVMSMFGYRIDIEDDSVILTSIYSFSSEDVLKFKIEGGLVELLNEGLAPSLNNEVQTYLVNGNSVPAFLAAVTINLYNQSTFG